MSGHVVLNRGRPSRVFSFGAAVGAALIFAVAAPQAGVARDHDAGGHAGGGHVAGGHVGGGGGHLHAGGGWHDGWHGGWHHGRRSGGWGWGWSPDWDWYAPDWDYSYDYSGYTYPYSYGYSYSNPYRPPGVADAGGQYWYYCASPAGYYPYVRQCNGPWQPVVPQGPG